MNGLFTSSTAVFFYFLAAGSIIVYLILKFDKKQRHKLKRVLYDVDDVKPLFLKKHADQKLNAFKIACNHDEMLATSAVAKQVYQLVDDYETGRIALPDYCNHINRLLDKVA